MCIRDRIKAIQTELGDKDGTDVEELREKLEKTPLNDEARQKAEKELERLSHMAPGTPEIGISRTYVEWILDLPWGDVYKRQQFFVPKKRMFPCASALPYSRRPVTSFTRDRITLVVSFSTPGRRSSTSFISRSSSS